MLRPIFQSESSPKAVNRPKLERQFGVSELQVDPGELDMFHHILLESDNETSDTTSLLLLDGKVCNVFVYYMKCN